MNTVLYEAKDKPGGRAYVYHDEGYTFDAGPTVVTAPHTLEELFELTDRKLEDYIELMEVAPYVSTYLGDGDRFDYVRDADKMLEQIRQRSEKMHFGYQEFSSIQKVFDKGYTDLVDRPFLRFSDMLKANSRFDEIESRHRFTKPYPKYVKDEHLRQTMSFLFTCRR